MSRAPRRRVGARPWELEEAVRSNAARADYEERRARERQVLRDRALADARKHGASNHWRTYWLVIGLAEVELDAIRAEAILGGST